MHVGGQKLLWRGRILYPTLTWGIMPPANVGNEGRLITIYMHARVHPSCVQERMHRHQTTNLVKLKKLEFGCLGEHVLVYNQHSHWKRRVGRTIPVGLASWAVSSGVSHFFQSNHFLNHRTLPPVPLQWQAHGRCVNSTTTMPVSFIPRPQFCETGETNQNDADHPPSGI